MVCTYKTYGCGWLVKYYSNYSTLKYNSNEKSFHLQNKFFSFHTWRANSLSELLITTDLFHIASEFHLVDFFTPWFFDRHLDLKESSSYINIPRDFPPKNFIILTSIFPTLELKTSYNNKHKEVSRIYIYITKNTPKYPLVLLIF